MEIRELTNTACIPMVKTEVENLNRLVGGRTHQGVVAISSPVAFHDIEMIVPHLFENDKNPLILILDHVKDVRNFGAITRSAEVLGVHAIVIPKKGSAAINEDAIKTSAGALFKIPICRVSNIANTIDYLQTAGLSIFASNSQTQHPISDVDFSGPSCLIIGSEGRGVQYDLIRKADQDFIIPQLGETDSLNVSVATGIMLYEVMKQRSLIFSKK